MCLITNQKEPLIAEEDMVVYKLLRKEGLEIKAPFNDFHYRLNERFDTEIKESTEIRPFDVEDERNLIKLLGDSFYYLDLSKIKAKGFMSIGRGFHSAAYVDRIISNEYGDISIYKCIIPKGSKFYMSYYKDLIVSSSIIIIERIQE